MARQRKQLREHLRKHGIPATLSVLVLLMIGISVQTRLAGSFKAERLADIAVEHLSPLEFKVSLSRRAQAGILDIESSGGEAIKVSLPSEWIRAEVRNVSLDAVTAEAPMFSFTRWTIPDGAGVRFLIADMPDGFMLHNQSDATLELTTTYVDLDKDTVVTDVRLVKDGAIRIW